MTDKPFDYVIVGAGSAGAVIAARLSENPETSVLVLEAGPDFRGRDAPTEMRSGHWSAILEVARFPSYQWPKLTARRAAGRGSEPYWRGRGVGGSSSINGQVAIRPPLDDFADWSPTTAVWHRASVLAAFCRLEDDIDFGAAPWHGQGGPIPISRAPIEDWAPLDHALRDAAMSLGLPWTPDCNAPGATGVSTFAYNARDEVRVSTNDGYLEPARARTNLEVRGGALVDRVVLRSGRAVGVDVLVGAAIERIHAGEVILAAGAVHSPAVLQRSGIGPAAVLRELGIEVIVDLAVGDNFQEHPHVYFGFPVGLDQRGAVNGRHTNACMRWTSGVAGTRRDDMMGIVNGPAPAFPGFAGLGLWVNDPSSRGRVRIRSTDPTLDPDIDMFLAASSADRARLRHCIDRAKELFDHPSFRAIVQGPVEGIDGTALHDLDTHDIAATDAWIGRVVDGSAHASATCAMGVVVDETCRVNGVDGLRVVDLSVVPRVPRANTNLTAIMIGEHMAGLLVPHVRG